LITATFQPSFREHVRALRAINRVLPRVRWMKRLGWACLFAAIIVLFVDGAEWLFAYLLLLPLVLFAVLAVLPPWMAWLARSQSPIWRSEQRITVDERGVEHSAAGAGGLIAWAAITRVAETKHFLLFFTSPQCAHYVPKAAFPGEALQNVRRFAERAGQPGGEGDGAAVMLASVAEPRADDVAYARFDWDPKQMYRVFRLATRYGSRQWPIYLWMLALGAWTGGPTLYRQFRDGGFGNVSLGLLALSLFPLVLVLAIGPLMSWWAARRLPRVRPSVRGPITVAVGPRGVRSAGLIASGEVPWSALLKTVETQEFFLFFVSKLQALYLPKVSLEASSVASVRTLAASELGKRFINRS
jgi:hypothetical protein